MEKPIYCEKQVRPTYSSNHSWVQPHTLKRHWIYRKVTEKGHWKNCIKLSKPFLFAVKFVYGQLGIREGELSAKP